MLGGGVGDRLGQVDAAVGGLLDRALELLLLAVQRGALGHGEVGVGELARSKPNSSLQPAGDGRHLRRAADQQAAVDLGSRRFDAAASSARRVSSIVRSSSVLRRLLEVLARDRDAGAVGAAR